jgi:hypothetical protein
MRRFTSDFKEMRTVLGVENKDDVYDWSQFDIQIPSDIEKIARQYRRDLVETENRGDHMGFPKV